MAVAKTTKSVLPVVKVKKLDDKAKLPQQMTEGSAGLDLCVLEDTQIRPTTSTDVAYKVRTGLAVAIPDGYVGKIYLRSSTGAKTKLRLANGTGIIDSDYRGEVMVLLENVGSVTHYIAEGERLFQLLIEKQEQVKFEQVEELDETQRGTGGMGSTGSK